MSEISRTSAATTPEEILRQSQRIVEQYNNLSTILNNVWHWLDEMGYRLKEYDPNIASRMDKLRGDVYSFGKKSNPIYTDFAKALENYANGSKSNLDALQKDITDISAAISDL